MGLTETKLKDLREKKFDQLYSRHRAAWADMARIAYDFAKANITKGREPRPDDVHKALLLELENSDDFRHHQEDNKARSKRFLVAFGDYIVDEFLATRRR